MRTVDLVLAGLAAMLALVYTAGACAEPSDASGWVQALLSWGFVAAFGVVTLRAKWASISMIALNVAWSAVWILAPVNLGYTLWVLAVPVAVFVSRRFAGGRFGAGVLAAAMVWALASPFMWAWDERFVLFYRSGVDAVLALAAHWAVLAVAYLLGANLAREEAGRRERLRVAREQERLAIAGDIHDLLGHTLTLIRVQANAGLAAGDERAALKQISAEAGEALTDIRRLVRGLRDGGSGVEPTAGVEELPELVQRFRDAGVRVRYEGGALPQVPAVSSLAAHRIVAEAVANAARHQEDPDVRVRVEAADRLAVTVASTGPIRPRPGAGTGLEGCRERAASAGGTLSTEQRGDTFIVRAELGR
ncbi:sensor histidine kinase [Corynebacterium hadale]|uniref:sensor histidine kinase n=1 Tax=Corynebacterium hadale TaxID=2026255 RepID=UPI000BAA6BBD|nr:histidine kinase [Corynebacterium hadale]PAT08022.1 hypothetical protein CKJ82_07145 [Corynebacterium hadale]